ncbi:MAG: filamentous hemagglutinin family protein [Betaproteobacteria bacterium]
MPISIFAAGFNRVAVYSNGSIQVQADAAIDLAPGAGTDDAGNRDGSSLALHARSIEVKGSIRAPSAAITLSTHDTIGPLEDRSAYGITLGAGTRIEVNGRWINDLAAPSVVAPRLPLAIDGGSVSINSVADLRMQAGSAIDVSAGGRVAADRKLVAGHAGSIALASGRLRLGGGDRQQSMLVLDGALVGYGLTQGQATAGGTLSLSTSSVSIGGRQVDATQLALAPSFFASGGFSQYNINGQDGVTFAGGVTLAPSMQVRIADAGYVAAPSADAASSFTTVAQQPLQQRTATSISITANSKAFGDVSIGDGAAIRVEPTGAIKLVAGNQLTVAGTLEARAGNITLATLDAGQDEAYAPGQSIWLTASARLLANGYARALTDARGLRRGDVLAGGSVHIGAGRGYVVTQAGSLIDVSGTTAVLDIPQAGGVAPVFVGTQIAGDAGEIAIAAQEGLLLDGAWNAHPGGAGARGGSIALTLNPRINNNASYPTGDSILTVSASGQFIPAGLRPGQTVDADALDPQRSTRNHRGFVSAATLAQGDFDTVTLRSPDEVRFSEAVTLSARRSVTIDALALTGTTDARAQIAAAYVSIGSTSGFTPKSTLAGDAQLQVTAQLIDLEGDVLLRGFSDARFVSGGDIRLKGVFIEGGAAALKGSLVSAGDIALTANQIYPTTLADFEIAVRDNPSGVISVHPGTGGTPVFSAGGRLTMSAPRIDQRGVVKAPFGTVVLNASEQLTLADGSLTSVSGEGQQVMFGRTDLSGNDYVYALSSSTRKLLTSVPDKRVSLSAPAIRVAPLATVDLSGGGDLIAYEFTPGPGGSKDLLDPVNAPNAFAVLPGFAAKFAPYDHQEYAAGTAPSMAPGDQVYLSGANGLPAGYYTVLPARYALLAGAWLVAPVAGRTDLLPSQSSQLADGGQIISGYRRGSGIAGDIIGDTRSSGFLVHPGSYARQQSEYLETTASAFFAGGASLPTDAGLLSVQVTRALQLDGSVLAARTEHGRGASIDISAPRIAVVNQRGADDGSVQIETAVLNRMTVESLLLGGVRTLGSDGWLVTPGASEVVVRNSDATTLTASEVMLVATDRVTVAAGAAIAATGTARGGTPVRFDAAASGNIADGAFLRVSSADASGIRRQGTDSAAHGGVVQIGAGAALRGRSIDIDATQDTSISTDVQLFASAVSLAASRISVGAAPAGTVGVTLTGELAQQLQHVTALTLRSYSTLDFYANGILGAADPITGAAQLANLTIDAAGIRGIDAPGTHASITAGTVRFENTSTRTSATVERGRAPVEINADTIEIGVGAKALTGFQSVTANARNDIVFMGDGQLATQADTTLRAARITTTARSTQSLDTGSGALALASSVGGAVSGASSSAAARLNLTARRISSSIAIDVQGGDLTLSATGAGLDDGVTLASGAWIFAGGAQQLVGSVPVYARGGSVQLTSAHGNVNALAGSTIDVAGAQERASGGALVISAINGTISLAGSLHGAVLGDATSGQAKLDALNLTNFAALNRALAAGGFRESLEWRARTGDVNVTAADTVRARNVAIAADGGNLVVDGAIDASGSKAGKILLAAGNDLTLNSGARLSATATAAGAPGGEIEVSTSQGNLRLNSGSAVDVGSGTLLLRAPRNGTNEIAIGPFGATVNDAAQVVAEGVKRYSDVQTLGNSAGPRALSFSEVASDNAAFMANAANIRTRLGWSAQRFQLRPGVEVQSTGDLTLTADWNLFSTTRPGGQPGFLTLRAAGDLNLNGSLSDGFSTALRTGTLQSGASWSYRLIAGADLSAADVRAVQPLAHLTSSGDLTLAAGKLVRTGTGTIEIAAGRDIKLAAADSVIYTAGVPGPSVAGFVVPRAQEVENGRTVFNIVPDYPTGGGNVAIAAQRDVIGAPGPQLINDWLYRRTGGLASGADYAYVNPQTTWWPRFSAFQQGVGALGGGDVRLAAGRDIDNVAAVIPTNGRLGGTLSAAPGETNLVVQGGGDLSVVSGRDILGGVYYVGRGDARISAQGGMVAGRSILAADGRSLPLHTVLALGDAKLSLSGGTDIEIETIFNPTLVRQFSAQTPRPLLQQSSFNTYSETSAVEIVSSAGSVSLFNNRDSALSQTAPQIFGADGNSNLDALTLFPASLNLVALGGDVNVLAPLSMYPSHTGDLQILAGGNVLIGGTLNMLDTAPSRFPQVVNPVANFDEAVLLSVGRPDSAIIAHSNPPLHLDDPAAVVIVAGQGDVTVANLSSLSLPKPARISAGRDLRDLNLRVQNLRDTDVSELIAGRDLVFASARRDSGVQETNTSAIQIGGPGRLEISAGRDVDLGTSTGILSRGSLDNPFLPQTGASIVVTAGLGTDVSGSLRLPDVLAIYVNAKLEQYGASLATALPESEQAQLLAVRRAQLVVEFNTLPAENRNAFARELLFAELRQTGRAFATTGNYDQGYRAIDWLFPNSDAQDAPIVYRGDIKLFFSQIKTEQGGGIDLLAPSGLINAGLANPSTLTKDPAQLGVVTVDGGSVRSFSRSDFLVNQSRVFTLAGGDVLIWSSEGNIDAGKGAKTTSVTSPPQLKIDANGNFSFDITQSIQGSGIGVLLAKPGIAPGDVDLLAPRGEVNAGDAGIRVAGNLNIAALHVVGADNIRVGGVASGVPVAPTTTLAASNAGVANAAADASKAAELASQTMAAGNDLAKSTFMPSFITVELLGLGTDEASRSEKNPAQ